MCLPGANDDSCSLQSEVSWEAVGGQEYYIFICELIWPEWLYVYLGLGLVFSHGLFDLLSMKGGTMASLVPLN